MEVEERWLQVGDHLLPDVQEARSPGPPQEFPSCRREHVAPDSLHIQRPLASRLAGVQQIGDAGLPGESPNLFGRVHQPAVGGDMGNPHKGHSTFAQLLSKSIYRQLAMLIVRDHLDHGSGSLGHLQVGDVVAGVLSRAGKNPVPRLERHGVKSHVPSPGGVFHQGHLVGEAIQESGNRRVGLVYLGLGSVGCFISPDLRLQLQVLHHRVQNRLGRKGGASIVEVGHPGAAWSLPASTEHVKLALLVLRSADPSRVSCPVARGWGTRFLRPQFVGSNPR